MAFSNRIKKTMKLMTSVVQTNGRHCNPMRIPYVGRNSVWSGANINNNNVNPNSIVWRDKYFDALNHDSNLHSGCKMKKVDLMENICNDIDDDLEEEQDIDVDFLHCNEKLCKDNDKRYRFACFICLALWFVLFVDFIVLSNS